MINMEIVKYKPEYKNNFIRLSKNWITKYFALESDDFEVFENIDKLIKNGAMIYFAIENGANKLTILSNSILKPALHIYEKYGFYEIPVDNTHHYKRVDIQFEYTTK